MRQSCVTTAYNLISVRGNESTSTTEIVTDNSEPPITMTTTENNTTPSAPMVTKVGIVVRVTNGGRSDSDATSNDHEIDRTIKCK